MSDAYDFDRFLIKSNGSVTKDNGDVYGSKDTKNHVYAENLKDARAKAVKKGLIVKRLSWTYKGMKFYADDYKGSTVKGGK